MFDLLKEKKKKRVSGEDFRDPDAPREYSSGVERFFADLADTQGATSRFLKVNPYLVDQLDRRDKELRD